MRSDDIEFFFFFSKFKNSNAFRESKQGWAASTLPLLLTCFRGCSVCPPLLCLSHPQRWPVFPCLFLKEGLSPLQSYFGIRPPSPPPHNPCARFTENSQVQTGQACATGEVTPTLPRACDFLHAFRHSHFLLLLILLLLIVRNKAV